MKARFTPAAIWTYLRSTYWFLPSVITLACIGLAIGLTQLEGDTWDRSAVPDWFFGGGPDGARALLSAVAGSMITVVSVTFSVTIVALTVSSQHFGPRLLNSFMRDTSAQIVLGIFIGTFAYCLVVLRTVQGDGDGYDIFVPHLAVTAALALTGVSVAALIFYVHHVAASLQVSQIARAVVVDLEASIERLYPEHLGDDAGPAESAPLPPGDAIRILATAGAYVQHIEADQVLQLASEEGMVIWLKIQPGDFVTAGLPIAEVHPAPSDLERATCALNDALVLGADRTSDQDVGFPMQQLVEVTLHALSSGMNEPFTAVTCIDRLGQGLARLVTRRMPSPMRSDDSGAVRVVALSQTFAGLLDGAIDPIRAHAAGSPDVGLRLLVMLDRIARLACRDEDRAAVRRQATLVMGTMEQWLGDGTYGERLEQQHRSILQATDTDRVRRASR